MTQLFQIVALSLNLNAAPAQAQKCTSIAQVAPQAAEEKDQDFSTCQFPSECSGKAEIKEVVATTYKPCKWPNCSKKPVKAESKDDDFGICLWPEKCNGLLGTIERI